MKPDLNPINIIILVINSLGLILTVPAICGLFTVVRNDHVVPIYVINLLISDLIQICYMIVLEVDPENYHKNINPMIFIFDVMARAGFMMCVALERYLVIAWPHWYQFKRSVTVSVLISLIVWQCPFIPYLIGSLSSYTSIIIVTFFLLPLPVFVFSLVGTLKSLSAAISVSSEEKRQIVGAVVLVLCSYTLSVFVIIFFFFLGGNPALSLVFAICSSFSPLLDLVLYVFMGKGATDKLRALLCCCRKETQRPKQQVLTVSGDRTGTVSSM
ncbi:mas-related G-protein coupled receptor member B5-like [Mastacembelus armatus]|uniref:mas-related G-protein coupled receptor member B5-like n=1 Tax=Mastacembelus armatus TaxID=205130 RepID=UPI000E45EF13|nr:mas-related G-protein coupled receptor member B5-like [Mastacembelus armatus]